MKLQNLKKFSLHFKNQELENQFIEFTLTYNQRHIKKLLFFNFVFYIIVSTYFYIVNDKYSLFYMAFVNYLVVLAIFWCYCYFKAYKHLLQNTYLFFSIVIPFVFGSYFFSVEKAFLNQSIKVEYFSIGFCFCLLISNIQFFKLHWYFICFTKLSSFVFMQIFLFIQKNDNEISLLLTIFFFYNIYFDYERDTNERESFYTEYLFFRNSDNLKKILEEIPDLVLIWKNDGLIFVNQAIFKLFGQNDLKSLQNILLKQIEIIDAPVSSDNTNNINLCQKSTLMKKILEILKTKEEFLTFQNFNGYIKLDNLNNDLVDNEFDIKMKKIYWEKEVSVMILLSKVDEIQLKKRLQTLNNFLTKVIGQISHEMNTPLHIILSIIDRIRTQIHDKNIRKELQIAKNTAEILLYLVKIMIDIFQIRKGNLFLEISRTDLEKAIQDVLHLFDDSLLRKGITINLKIHQTFIQTDPRRFKEIIVSLLNKTINRINSGDILITIQPCEYPKSINKFYRISFEIRNKKELNAMIATDISPGSYLVSPRKKMQMKSKFSIIDYLILCLSCGNLESKKINSFMESSEEIHLETSKCCFEICSIEGKNIIDIKDPFKENFDFQLNLNYCETSPETSMFSSLRPENRYLNSKQTIESIPLVPLKKRYTILNVDDIYYSMMVISNYCKSCNLPFEEAKNGLEAFEKVKDVFYQNKKSFKIIFMDCDMPIMDGFEASKKINEFYKGQNMSKHVIIAVTANVTNNEIKSKIKECGIKEMVHKPFRIDQFKEIIKKYLNQ